MQLDSRDHDPSYQASTYVLVAEPQWFGPISVLWGTTGSYSRALGVTTKRSEAIVRKQQQLLKKVSVDVNIASVIFN